MIRYTDEKTTYVIDFKHGVDNGKRYTECALSFIDKNNLVIDVYKQRAICNINDNFSKDYGRKLSMSKCLKWLKNNFSHIYGEDYIKNLKTNLWQQYFEKTNKLERIKKREKIQ